MKINLLGLAIVLLFFSCKEENKITQREIKQYSIEQFMENEAVSGGSFSSDNSNLLVSSNRSGIYNVYKIPSKGGEMRPITQSDSTSIFCRVIFSK